MLMSPSLSAKLQTLLRITEMTFNFKFHSTAETMQFILVPSIWDLQRLNQLELSLILDRNTWPLPVFFATMRRPAIINSRNMTHSQAVLSKETRLIRDARPWPMTCTSLSQTRSFPRLPQSLPMDLLSFKVSYGRITLPSSHLRAKIKSLQTNLRLI